MSHPPQVAVLKSFRKMFPQLGRSLKNTLIEDVCVPFIINQTPAVIGYSFGRPVKVSYNLAYSLGSDLRFFNLYHKRIKPPREIDTFRGIVQPQKHIGNSGRFDVVLIINKD